MSSLGVLALRHPLCARGVCAASSSRLFSVLRHGGALAQQQAHQNKSSSSSSQLEKSSSEAKGGQLQTSFAQKAKENAATAGYAGVIVGGLAVTAAIAFVVLRELFSGESPNALFQRASDECVANGKVQDLLGEPIKAFGEETRRGRRRHVSHLEYVDDQGRRGMRVKFYLQGTRRRGTAQLDAREDASGRLQTRFLIVTTQDLLGTTVIVEDNR